MWVLTLSGLVPWDKLFGRKKDFHEQLAELDDGYNPYNSAISGNDVPVGDSHAHAEAEDRLDALAREVERVYGPWGSVPYSCPVRKRL